MALPQHFAAIALFRSDSAPADIVNACSEKLLELLLLSLNPLRSALENAELLLERGLAPSDPQD